MTALVFVAMFALFMLGLAPLGLVSAPELRKSRKRLLDEMGTLAKKDTLTEDEQARFEAAKSEADALKAKYERIESVDAELDALKTVEPVRRSAAVLAVTETRDSFLDDPKFGWRGHNDFLLAVLDAGRGGKVPPNLAHFGRTHEQVRPANQIRAAAGADEHSTASQPYGGFLIPTTILPGVESTTAEGDPLLPYTRKVTMDTPSIKVNARVDKNHTTSVSGGLVVYRPGETQPGTASRMQFEQVELEANDLIGITYATNKLLQASPIAFVSLLSAGFNDEFGAKLTEERLNGTGVGQFLGVTNSDAKIQVAKESAQTADTVNYTNCAKMWARCFRPSQAVWVVNNTVLPQLLTMTQPGGTIPVVPANTPGGFGLFGRPIIVTERAAAVGDVWDIALVNWQEYLEGEYTPMQEASSIHVRFNENEQVFKFWKCNAGAPWWRTFMTPVKGATLSPFVYLEAR